MPTRKGEPVAKFVMFTMPGIWVHKDGVESEKIRKALEYTCAICLGRCKWTENIQMIVTAEQYAGLITQMIQLKGGDVYMMEPQMLKSFPMTSPQATRLYERMCAD